MSIIKLNHLKSKKFYIHRKHNLASQVFRNPVLAALDLLCQFGLAAEMPWNQLPLWPSFTAPEILSIALEPLQNLNFPLLNKVNVWYGFDAEQIYAKSNFFFQNFIAPKVIFAVLF